MQFFFFFYFNFSPHNIEPECKLILYKIYTPQVEIFFFKGEKIPPHRRRVKKYWIF